MNFRPTNRLTSFLMPPSVDEWLPQRHLARFVVEVVDGLDLCAMSKSYRGSGSASYHPAVLLSLLVYGCATGVFSSRKLERAGRRRVRAVLQCAGSGGRGQLAGGGR
jgi:transposase